MSCDLNYKNEENEDENKQKIIRQLSGNRKISFDNGEKQKSMKTKNMKSFNRKLIHKDLEDRNLLQDKSLKLENYNHKMLEPVDLQKSPRQNERKREK